jgi:hypothetical protein
MTPPSNKVRLLAPTWLKLVLEAPPAKVLGGWEPPRQNNWAREGCCVDQCDGEVGHGEKPPAQASLSRGKCGLLTLFCGKGVLMALCLGECGLPACFLGLSVPPSSLIGNGLCSRGSRLSTLLLRLQCMCAAFVLVLHVGECGLMLQSSRGLASKPGEEAMAADERI